VNRALRAATMGVLLLSPLALSACSAGQITQTAGQERDKVGAMAEVGQINLRAVEFASPRGGVYENGDDVELRMAIVNESQEDDALVDISGEGFGEVEIDDGSATSSGSGSGADEIEIPADDVVYIDGEDLTVTLTDIDESLTTGQSLELTFTFENAGEVTVPVIVSAPDDEVGRDAGFDFHHEEGGGSGSEEQREGEQREGGE
jgi:copper(I)-binding protein